MRTIKLSGSFLQTDNVDHIELNVNVNILSNDDPKVGNETKPTGTYNSVSIIKDKYKVEQFTLAHP